MFVIRPFHSQDATALTVALWVHQVGPWISGVCAALLVAVTGWSWTRVRGTVRRVWFRSAMVSLCVVAIAGALLTHVNIFEKMFHPYDAPAFGSADVVPVDRDDKVLAVWLGGHARAYPIRTMGYHHIVNDTVGGRADCGDVLHAVSHRTGLGSYGEWNEAAFSIGWDQQWECTDSR
ncbi:MAG TPA: DUF3179 domain-containing (seleno)protein [Edaphobacter sp.]